MNQKETLAGPRRSNKLKQTHSAGHCMLMHRPADCNKKMFRPGRLHWPNPNPNSLNHVCSWQRPCTQTLPLVRPLRLPNQSPKASTREPHGIGNHPESPQGSAGTPSEYPQGHPGITQEPSETHRGPQRPSGTFRRLHIRGMAERDIYLCGQ